MLNLVEPGDGFSTDCEYILKSILTQQMSTVQFSHQFLIYADVVGRCMDLRFYLKIRCDVNKS